MTKEDLKKGQGVMKAEKQKRRYVVTKVLMLLVLSFSVLTSLVMSPLFNIKSIEIVGLKRYPEAEVIAASGLTPGSSGFREIGGSLTDIVLFRCKKAEELIKKNRPYIKDVVVRYILPGKVKITVEEREPIALLPFLGTYLLLDRDAYVVDTVNSRGDAALPLLKGLETEGFKLGHRLETENMKGFERFKQLMETIEQTDEKSQLSIRDLVDLVDVSDPSNVRMLVDKRIDVNLGDLRELVYRLDSLRQIYLVGIGKDERGTLDFTAGENPVFQPGGQSKLMIGG